MFASSQFDKIINEIRDAGFAKGQKVMPQDPLEVAIRQLRDGWNDRAYIRLAVRLLNEYVARLDGEVHDRTYGLLLDNDLSSCASDRQTFT